MNITSEGITCQRWDVDYPHLQITGPEKFPEKNLTKVNNYCRLTGLFGLDAPWCFTIDPNVYIGYCDITLCGKFIDTHLSQFSGFSNIH